MTLLLKTLSVRNRSSNVISMTVIVKTGWIEGVLYNCSRILEATWRYTLSMEVSGKFTNDMGVILP